MAAGLKAQLEIGADVSGVESGITKAKRSIKTLGKAAADAGQEAAAGLDGIAQSGSKASKSIDAYVKRVQFSAATIGKTASEIKLFELAQRGASQAQLRAADSAFRSIDAYKSQQAALLATADAHKTATAAAQRHGAILGTIALAAVTATAALFRGSINAIDRFNDLSDATGASIENISALDRVARQTGGSFETVSGVLIKFNSILNKTDEDGEDAARVLKATCRRGWGRSTGKSTPTPSRQRRPRSASSMTTPSARPRAFRTRSATAWWT